MALTVASLFAGLGGFDLAAEELGLRVALQAELDPSARAVLSAHYPRVELVHDATKADLRGIDVVTAGFPCQGLSNAATTRKHSGLLDPKSASAVVWQVLDRIEKARPPYLLLENADSLQTAKYAADLRALLSMLEAHGYFPVVVRLNAGCYGSNMRRIRTFILCRRQYWLGVQTKTSVSWTCDAAAIGVNNQQGGAVWCAQPSVTKQASSYSLMVTRDEVRSLTPEAVEALFGLPTGWTAPAGSWEQRYDRLGNAVSVHAARAALQLLLTGKAQVSTPDAPYAALYPLTRPMPGSTAASAVGRIVRAIEAGSNQRNEIEMRYCLPTYMNWINAHPSGITEKMHGYLRSLAKLMPRGVPMTPWPRKQTVTMTQ